MIDPVTGFSYPDEWVSRAGSRDELTLVSEGRAILTASGTILRRGITTGATAAAATKAAILSLKEQVEEVSLLLPCGIRVTVPVTGDCGSGSAVKDPGDYPEDRTAGLLFRAHAVPDDGVLLHAGEGIPPDTRRVSRQYPLLQKTVSSRQ